MNTSTLLIENESSMLSFGKALAQACGNACVIYLQGELGAGKTTLVRGFLQGLGHLGKVKSPTYTLVEPYCIHDIQIFHFDLYRLNDPLELETMGIRDYFAGEAICLIEWPERGQSFLPPPDLHCRIELLPHERKLVIESKSEKGHKILNWYLCV